MKIDTKHTTISGKTYVFRASRTLSPDECAEHLRGISASRRTPRLKKGETAIIWLNF
jgi:hypothetical protein